MTDSDSLLLHSTVGGAIPKISQAVDLALPSGTLWAPWNVGASAPDQAGAYFAWGETTPAKERYEWRNYKFHARSNKYNLSDGKRLLDPEDDAASANWGTIWMMPTAAQFEELRNECEWTWISSPVPGFVVASVVNGLSIFLPAAGNVWKDETRFVGQDGNYWSANIRADEPQDATLLFFFHDGCYLSTLNRCFGRPVRPVLAI